MSNYTKDDVVSAILFAESEGDWDEVEKLYKILFKINDGGNNVLEKAFKNTDNLPDDWFGSDSSSKDKGSDN